MEQRKGKQKRNKAIDPTSIMPWQPKTRAEDMKEKKRHKHTHTKKKPIR